MIAQMGHTLCIVPAKGVADVLREGVKAEGGETLELDKGVIEHSSHTMIYPDKRLLSRLLAAYPDLNENANVTIIEPDRLDEWVKAIETVATERQTR